MDHLLTVESTEEADSRQAWTPAEDRDIRPEGPSLVLGDLGGVYLFECRTGHVRWSGISTAKADQSTIRREKVSTTKVT